jgi:hypothetical protein
MRPPRQGAPRDRRASLPRRLPPGRSAQGIESVEAADGELAVRFAGGEAIFDLGPKAARWAERIRNPRTRLDKLGVKPDSVISVVNVNDTDFRAELEARVERYTTAPVPESTSSSPGPESVGEIERIGRLVPYLKSNGHIWVVAPKGRQDIREMDVLEAGRAAGLKDTKVARFSETHTAHRFTIPLEAR